MRTVDSEEGTNFTIKSIKEQTTSTKANTKTQNSYSGDNESVLSTKRSGSKRHSVVSPIPGKITRTFVSNGDNVRQGEVLLELEAMKMSNDITSPYCGKILSILPLGKNVSHKEILVVIEIDTSNED